MKLVARLEQTFELMQRIDQNLQSPDTIAQNFFHSRRFLGSHDRQFISETVFGMLRSKRRVEVLFDYYLRESHLNFSASSPFIGFLPLYVAYKIAIERLAVKELYEQAASYWKDFIPQIDFEHFVAWMSNPEVLDSLPGDEITRLGIRYSFDDWMVREWSNEFRDETESLLRSLNVPARTTLRVNSLKATREECQRRLRGEGIETDPTTNSPAGLACMKRFNRDTSRAFREGWFEFQDEGSQLISYFADSRPGMFVVDACAGTGGKTLHLAALMKNEGEVLAVDVEPRRLAELTTRALRAGIRNVRTISLADLRPDVHRGKADLVLVDAPCSGVGTIRRNPWKKWNVAESSIEQFSAEQRKILDANSEFVRSHGRLVYATCSLFKKENEDVVNGFLGVHKDFVLEDSAVMPQLQTPYPPGAMVHLLPHRHDTDGFFVALMTRTA